VIGRPDTHRQAFLATSLAAVRANIADACTAVGRSVAEITLIAVTKGFPVEDIQTLVRLGVNDVGESRDQAAREKVAELAAAADVDAASVRWHFIGQLQTNKARSVAQYAHAVHSVDRPELVTALSAGAARVERDIDAFIQVSLDGDAGRGGARIDEVARLAELVVGAPRLRLAGVMAVAPLGQEPDAAFATLAEVSQRLRVQYPDASAISAGMSTDFAIALAHGATHLRIGSALLGRRNDILR